MHNSQHTDSDLTQNITRYLIDDAATLALGSEISDVLHAGLTIYLNGNLGAGKTTLARGILHGLGYKHVVKSPTYNLVEIYKISRLYLYHFDFYRFNDPIEWEEAGFREYFNTDTVCLVEWTNCYPMQICRFLSTSLSQAEILKFKRVRRQENDV